MPTEPFKSLSPRLHPKAFVHPSAQLLGDVELSEDSSTWPLVVMRGDSGAIRIGARSNVQDLTVIHATDGLSKSTVGEECTVGHRVILHGCTVGDRCLVGMGSILLDNVEVGDDSFIAAGSLLTPNKKFPPRSFIMGSPAIRVREVSEKDVAWIAHSWRAYKDLADAYRSGR